jgi:lysophospholipase L1-like esterase
VTFSQRFVAVGDSFTEGVGDWDVRLPNGVRGWADRVAQQLILANPGTREKPGWGYANLAIRGRKIRGVLAEQIEPAVALKPTLATIYAGGNDILRPRIDIDALMAEYDAGIARLASTGATVLVFTGFDAVESSVFGKMRGRTAIYNELVREIAENHGAELVDYWRMREFRDWRYWDTDRLHMSRAGHTLMAAKVLETLKASHSIELPELEQAPALSRLAALRADAEWARRFVAPWISRRLRGVSSGDSLKPKYPEVTQPDWA